MKHKFTRNTALSTCDDTMELEEFFKTLRGKAAPKLADEYLKREVVAAFPTAVLYDQFKEAVASRYTEAESVVVAGTANWSYSLNPKKDFKPFDDKSDVDTVVVSKKHYMEAWEAMRSYHRSYGYRLSQEAKIILRRNGENVYSGFVSPMWIPDRQNRMRYFHQQTLNSLSDKNVNFKPIKMLFFRNWTEAVDYYSRGFRIAKGLLFR